VTENEAPALLAAASVTATVFAPVEVEGTVKVPEKLPFAPLEPAPVSENPAPPPKVAVNALVAANPVPVTVTVAPTAPLVGLNAIAGVTVNVAVAVLLLTLTRTVCAPAALGGTVNDAPENEPEPFVVVAGVSVTGVPSYVAVTEVLGGKLEPEIETGSPT
jgi:hypothetical protein